MTSDGPMRHRLAVVGCGSMESTHENGLRTLAGRLDVVATVDVLPGRAQRAADVLGAGRAAQDYRDVLPDVDAVLLALPHHLHHRIGKACLEAGKHVLMEKPMAISEAECLDLIDTARRHDRVLMTAYPMRFHPLLRQLKECIDQGVIGDVFQVSVWTEQLTHYEVGHWGNARATLGGGQFFSHGCHYVDLLLWLIGRPIRGSHFGTHLGTPWLEGEGTSNVTIEFESGALGYHFGTWGARASKLNYRLHAHGTEGMLEIEFVEGELRLHRPSGVEVLSSAASAKDFKYVQGELGHFLDCIETGNDPETNAADSLQGLRVIWRLYDAEERGVVADLRGLGLTTPIAG